ncbi:peptidoglycan recognition protein [Streptomyces sp. S.PNR 29]|uniref:peptidoglycan recognition protein family protein n=1 Tax=Streptomyces sp. S.PNR 29 TaxID=2973805 RepID=UPI0025AFEBB7|nr:peptidoglycan recognition protein [Streptomyces sp. S.PNR 29]MDN0200946.1 peptidoglycan recognition protein [Streptomyces sp. S.PNR 29]
MRGFLASSIGVTCAAALALPLLPPALAAHARPAPTAEAATKARPAPHAPVAPAAGPAAEPRVPGNTRSLPLQPLARDRAHGAAEQGLRPRSVPRFSLVGVVWNDPDAELRGRVQVRVRAANTHTWSGWQDIEPHNIEHAADPGTPEHTSARVRGATAPLWVGDSDGVEVRVRAAADPGRHAEPKPDSSSGSDAGSGSGTASDGGGRTEQPHPSRPTPPAAPPLPTGMRLELVDPGGDTAPPGTSTDVPRTGGSLSSESTEAIAASAVNADLAPLGATEIRELNRAETESELFVLRAGELTEQQLAKPYIGPRPRIVTRRGWGANETLREKKFAYTKKVKAAFVHHTASGGTYGCSQAPSLIRGIYRYHVRSMGWRDIGYNFVVDKCGKIYEGRAGGVAKPVLGAHTRGFNSHSMGIAVLGSYDARKPSSAAVKAVARLSAWKLGLYGVNPRGKTYLKSGGGNLYRKGRKARLNVISGHRDGFATSCPGGQLYRKLGAARSTAARYQGR